MTIAERCSDSTECTVPNVNSNHAISSPRQLADVALQPVQAMGYPPPWGHTAGTVAVNLSCGLLSSSAPLKAMGLTHCGGRAGASLGGHPIRAHEDKAP